MATSMNAKRVSGYLAAKLKQEFDLDNIRVWENPLNLTVQFEIEVFGERRTFVITKQLLESIGQDKGMDFIRNHIRKAVDDILRRTIDLRHNAIESVDDLKVLIDREDEHNQTGAVILSKAQADALVGDDELFKLIIQDPNTGANTLFGHPFRVWLGGKA